MNTTKEIYELVKLLPEEQANIVLKFAEFLHQKTNQNIGISNYQPIANNQSKGWSSEFLALYGSCTDAPIRIDNEGISEQIDDDLIKVFGS